MNSMIEKVITKRRTIRQFINTPLDDNLLNDLLETSSYAPYHHHIEPWNVIIAKTHEEKMLFLEEVFASYDRNNILKNVAEDKYLQIKENYKDAFVTPAVTMIVTAAQYETEKENFDAIAATSAFIQNFQLLAWEKEIGVVWRTNPFIFDQTFAKAMGVPENHKIVGSLQVGYFNQKQKTKTKKRRPLNEWVKRVLS